jgi:predicted RND superfamily exporter protein
VTARLRGSWAAVALALACTLVAGWLTATRLRVSTNLAELFPESGEAAALARWTRAFGGHDPLLLLVRSDRREAVDAAAARLAAALARAPAIERVVDRAPAPDASPDPTLAWMFAAEAARAQLAEAVTPAGMRARLAETRSLLLAPAGDERLERWLARDPLRLSLIPWESRAALAGDVVAAAGQPFTADEGRARLVVAQPRGSAFSSRDANTAMDEVDRAVAESEAPGVTIEVAGGHAIARATEAMLKRDLAVSGSLSIVLASAAFVATFRRVRALAAVIPPLIVGTLWTTGLAALFPAGLSAVAIAFAAVVVGVGVDTGVHVYAALLDARRGGLVGADAARAARAATARPTLTAAAVAGVAFAALGLSGLRAMQELGLLCGAGELLTAVAIVLVTPGIGAWLERGAAPARSVTPRWVEWVACATATRGRSAAALVVFAAPIGVLAVVGWPIAADALVAVRPRTLAPLAAEADVQRLFGGHPGQWFVLSVDRREDEARARADRVAEVLERLRRDGTIDGFDALATFDPSPATRRARLSERDALDLPARRDTLAEALRDAGFDIEACRAALDAFAHPAPDPGGSGLLGDSAAAFVYERHVAHDVADAVVVTYVRPRGDLSADARARRAILDADPGALVTGFDAIDRALRATLDRDLWLVGGVALAVVAIAMRLALRSASHTFVALATLACEMGIVGVAMRALGVRWHVYDALVLPVLFGVTIDESMFLLHSAGKSTMARALETQGPLVAATALTTAAGFAALVACRFDGLRDLGVIGTVGVLAGLMAALVVVPAALCVARPGGGGRR